MTNILKSDNFVVRIPNTVNRLRANCSKDYGQFVTGETKGMSVIDVHKAGLMKGNYIEIALCGFGTKVLTFQPHFINEEFVEIWGIPVSGLVKDDYPANASVLTTFLLRSQSKDKFINQLDKIDEEIFKSWSKTDMQQDYDEYLKSKRPEFLINKIFRFDFVKTESAEYGSYFYVSTTMKEPNSEIELAALDISKQIYLNHSNLCVDMRLEKANAVALEASSELKQITGEIDSKPEVKLNKKK
jgi:hypothetical protein